MATGGSLQISPNKVELYFMFIKHQIDYSFYFGLACDLMIHREKEHKTTFTVVY